MIKALIFDMDGLLIDSEPLWREAEIGAFNAIGFDFTEEMCASTMGMRLDQVVMHWFDKLQWKSPDPKVVMADILNRVSNLIRTKGRLLPGVLEVLELGKSLKLPMGIASSSPSRLIADVVDTFKIKSYFIITHSAEFELNGKPAPDVFWSAARKLNFKPENCLVLEDSPKGVEAAITGGFPVIAIPDLHISPKEAFPAGTYFISSLLDFDACLLRKF